MDIFFFVFLSFHLEGNFRAGRIYKGILRCFGLLDNTVRGRGACTPLRSRVSTLRSFVFRICRTILVEVPRRELNTKNLPVEWEIPCISRQVSVGVTTVPVWIHSDGRRLQSRNQNKHKLSLVTKIEISLEHLRLKYRYLEVELHLKSRAAVRSTLTPVESKAADSGSLADDAVTTSRWKCLEVIPTPHLSWWYGK